MVHADRGDSEMAHEDFEEDRGDFVAAYVVLSEAKELLVADAVLEINVLGHEGHGDHEVLEYEVNYKDYVEIATELDSAMVAP